MNIRNIHFVMYIHFVNNLWCLEYVSEYFYSTQQRYLLSLMKKRKQWEIVRISDSSFGWPLSGNTVHRLQLATLYY